MLKRVLKVVRAVLNSNCVLICFICFFDVNFLFEVSVVDSACSWFGAF